MAPTHDPITPSQIALLEQIEAAPLRLSVADLMSSGNNDDLQFLRQIGLVEPTQVHIGQTPGTNVYEWHRTAKSV